MSAEQIDKLDQAFIDGVLDRDEYTQKLAAIGEVPRWERGVDPEEAPPPSPGKQTENWFQQQSGWTQVGFIVGALVLLGYCFNGGTDDSSPPVDRGTAGGAWLICQQFIEDELRAPATAEYPSIDDRYITEVSGSDDVFEVNAYVDAENGFGALIRNDFVCRVRYQGDDVWRLENLEFDE